jgi:predicted anti-sigma-YlaC factor YlaD
VSCGEIERLFLAGAPAEDVRRHAKGCPTCRSLSADVDAAEQMSVGLQPPPLPVALRSKLIAIPRATVSCEGAERLLPLAIEGELGADDERRFASHLSRCEGCSEAAAVLFASRELADPIAPPWLAARLTAARPSREKRFWSRLLDPKAVIGLAYASAVVVMLLGFNPADLARRVRVGDLGQNTRAAVTVAESSLSDRMGALQEKVARTFAVWKGRASGYGRAAVSNVVSLIWKTSTTKDRSSERPRNRDGRGAFREKETSISNWRA